MYLGVDIAGVDKQPIENHSEGMVLFFIFFLLLGGFFIINMFVGVIVENFQKHGTPEEPSEEEVAAQKKAEEEHAAAVAAIVPFEDAENYSPFRRKVLKHATSTGFEAFIAVIIVLNVITMGSEHYEPSHANYTNDWDPMTEGFDLYLRITNYLFTAIYVYELIVKYIAFGFRRFHCGSGLDPRSMAGWNNFDIFIVFISILGILIDDAIGEDNVPVDASFLRILRILRVARILKLLKSAKSLVVLLVTVSRSLAQVGNLGLLMALLFFIYAALGIELFGRLECTDGNPCEGLSEYANFKNFGMANLVLFRLSTGDNWNGMMKDGLRDPPPEGNNVTIAQYGNKYGCSFAVSCGEPDVCCEGCDPDEECEENCCASAWMTPLYYMSFCTFSTFVMLNLVVATLMGELERAGNEDSGEAEEESQTTTVTINAVCEDAEGNNKDEAAVTSTDTEEFSKISDNPNDEPGATKGLGAGTADDTVSSPLAGLPQPKQTEPGLGYPSSGSDTLSNGSRVKLDPLPMPPVSPPPSVFVPFAPDTIAENEPEEIAEQNRVANSDIN